MTTLWKQWKTGLARKVFRPAPTSAVCSGLTGGGVAGAIPVGKRGDDLRNRRLDKEFVEPCFVGTLAVRLLPVPGEGHHQGILEPRHLTKVPDRLVTVHAGHADIQKHDVGLKIFGDLESASAAVGDSHLVARPAQHDGEGLGTVDIVIRHENSTWHRFPSRQVTPNGSNLSPGPFPERGKTDHELAAPINARTVGFHASSVELDQMPDQRRRWSGIWSSSTEEAWKPTVRALIGAASSWSVFPRSGNGPGDRFEPLGVTCRLGNLCHVEFS